MDSHIDDFSIDHLVLSQFFLVCLYDVKLCHTVANNGIIVTEL
jgi:hypothetical protein